MKLYIGTSGWNYADWKERFYPNGLKQPDWLGYLGDAEHIRDWLKIGKTVFVYFNNDVDGHAIDDSRRLKELLANHAEVAIAKSTR